MGRRDVVAGVALAAIGLAESSVCPIAAAQAPSDRPHPAIALFDEAKEMMTKGNFTEACQKLAQSEALDPQVGTMLNLAFCYEAIGKTASACSMWQSAGAAAERKSQADRAAFARSRAEGVCAHVSNVTVQVARQMAHVPVEIAINESPLPRDHWGSPVPLDPGEYELRASGAGLTPWSTKVFLPEGAASVVAVPTLAATDRRPPATASTPATGRGSRGLLTAAWTSAGLGAAAVGAGTAFGIAALANNNRSYSSGNCVGNACNAEGTSDRERAMRDARVADAFVAVGATAIATGVLLWIASSRPSRTGIYVQPTIGLTLGAVSVGEAW